MYKLKLYITGNTPKSRALIQELQNCFTRNCGGNYILEVIDIFDHPESAYEDMVLVTPTLIKTLPEPVQRLVGNLRDEQRMLAALGIESVEMKPQA